MSHASSPFFSGYSGDRVLPFFAWVVILLLVLPMAGGMTGVYNHAQIFPL
jgi:hypothetical protein